MRHEEAVPLLATWIRELRYELELRDRHIHALEGRCHRLEQAVRRDALNRCHWLRNGHKDRV